MAAAWATFQRYHGFRTASLLHRTTGQIPAAALLLLLLKAHQIFDSALQDLHGYSFDAAVLLLRVSDPGTVAICNQMLNGICWICRKTHPWLIQRQQLVGMCSPRSFTTTAAAAAATTEAHLGGQPQGTLQSQTCPPIQILIYVKKAQVSSERMQRLIHHAQYAPSSVQEASTQSAG